MGLCKTSDPTMRGYFWPQGNNLNNFGRGPLDEATYQISKSFQLKNLFLAPVT